MKLFKVLAFGLIFISLIWGSSGGPVQGEGTPSNFPVYLPMVVKADNSPFTYFAPKSIWLRPQPGNGQLYLVIDSSGQPHIFWAGGSGADMEVSHVYLQDTGWSATESISVPDSATRLTSQPAVGINNAIYLVFISYIKTGVPYQVRYMIWDGSQWGAQQILLDNSTSRTVSGEVRLNSQGNPYVYTRADDLDFFDSVKYNYRDWNGSGFGAMQSFNSPFNGGPYEYSWLDANGGLRLIGNFYSKTTAAYTFHYANWKNGSFQISNQTLAGSMEMQTYFLDNQNNTYSPESGTSQGGVIHSVYMQCMKNDLTFDQNKMISGSVDVYDYAWGFDETHTPVVAFSPSDGSHVTLQLWNGCQVSKQYDFTLPALPSNNVWGQLLSVAWNQQLGKACFLIRDKNVSTWMQCVEVK